MIGGILCDQPGDYTERCIGIATCVGDFRVSCVDVWNTDAGAFDTGWTRGSELKNGVRVISLKGEPKNALYAYFLVEIGDFEILWRSPSVTDRIVFQFSFDTGLNWHIWPGTFDWNDFSADEFALQTMSYILAGRLEYESGRREVVRQVWRDGDGKVVARSAARKEVM